MMSGFVFVYPQMVVGTLGYLVLWNMYSIILEDFAIRCTLSISYGLRGTWELKQFTNFPDIIPML